jgi:hypothetical protein
VSISANRTIVGEARSGSFWAQQLVLARTIGRNIDFVILSLCQPHLGLAAYASLFTRRTIVLHTFM